MEKEEEEEEGEEQATMTWEEHPPSELSKSYCRPLCYSPMTLAMAESRDTSRGQWRPIYPPSQKHVCGRQEALEKSVGFSQAPGRPVKRVGLVDIWAVSVGSTRAHWLVSS